VSNLPGRAGVVKAPADAHAGGHRARSLDPVGTTVVQIIALIKPFRAAAVIEALGGIEILGGTVREAMGYGRQKERLHRYLGSEYNASFLPKVELALFVRDEDAPAAVRAIVAQARTGRMGDGKIMVLPCLDQHVAW
jgi:nitrogen regulatory protein P-II 1